MLSNEIPLVSLTLDVNCEGSLSVFLSKDYTTRIQKTTSSTFPYAFVLPSLHNIKQSLEMLSDKIPLVL
jgi:hypothetical protein